VLTVTLDTNLFYDAAHDRECCSDFWKIVDLARRSEIALFYTATTDFEVQDDGVMRLVTRLGMEGILHEDPNAGPRRDYMPGGPGHLPLNDNEIDAYVEKVWPNATLLGLSYESKRQDVCHLVAHQRNGRDIFLTRDGELLSKRHLIKKLLGITIVSPPELLASLRKRGPNII
jgi:hypothetical protein